MGLEVQEMYAFSLTDLGEVFFMDAPISHRARFGAIGQERKFGYLMKQKTARCIGWNNVGNIDGAINDKILIGGWCVQIFNQNVNFDVAAGNFAIGPEIGVHSKAADFVGHRVPGGKTQSCLTADRGSAENINDKCQQ